MMNSLSLSIFKGIVGTGCLLVGLASSVLPSSSYAAPSESSISTTNPYAYAANAGWVNFRPDSANGTQVHESFLSGYAYAANFGWIHLGDGSPENGYSYSNSGSSDYGVNIAENGALTGYAYAPNVGWIVFEGQWGQPYLNFSTGKFAGFAYSGNIGWISLDTEFSDLVATHFVPPADTDGDGIADFWEMQNLGNLTKASASSDSDADGVTDLKEYISGTNPNNKNSKLRIVSHSYNLNNSTATIEFTTASNRLYRIEHDDDFQGLWTDSGHGLVSNSIGSTTTRSFQFPSGTKRFFRVNAIKPLQP